MDPRLLEKKNIVFDIGNVLLRWNKDELCRHFFPEERRELLAAAAFGSGLWSLADTGLITTGDLARLMCESVHSGNPEDFLLLTRLMDNFPEAMTPLEPVQWLPELKKMGKHLYYLTNYPTPQLEKTIAAHPFFSYFDGGVVSAHEHMIKPMPRIYLLLAERYGFSPQDALFIDDTAANVEAAIRVGYAGWNWRGAFED